MFLYINPLELVEYKQRGFRRGGYKHNEIARKNHSLARKAVVERKNQIK